MTELHWRFQPVIARRRQPAHNILARSGWKDPKIAIMSKVLKQCRKPKGLLGRLVARGMNFSHSQLTDWGLGLIWIGKDDTILDVGCGGGATIRKLARIAAEGSVHGIDYSQESVRISRWANRRMIEAEC